MSQLNATKENTVFINLTQHPLSNEQLDEVQQKGYEVANLPRDVVVANIEFAHLPSRREMLEKASTLAEAVKEAAGNRPAVAMIGGAPFYQGILTEVLLSKGIIPCFAFSVRRSVETTNDKGEVVKTSVFKHEGFILPHA